MYKQQADGQDGHAEGEAAAGSAGAGAKEDVVDAEFTEVDDDKNNKKSA
jgi:molecular chaperone DnaK